MPRKTTANSEDQKEFLKMVIEAAERRRSGVENKASIVLGANSILLAALGLLLKPPSDAGSMLRSLHPASAILLLLLVVAVTASILGTLVVLTDISSGRRRSLMKLPQNEFNVFYTGAIARHGTARAYQQAVEGLGSTELMEQLYNEAYNISCIVRERYKWFRFALLSLMASLMLLLAILGTALYLHG